jgi:hypothetical protein
MSVNEQRIPLQYWVYFITVTVGFVFGVITSELFQYLIRILLLI